MQIVDEEDLVIPHPRMAERAFVLVPMADVAADAVHPALAVTVTRLLTEVDGLDCVRRWGVLPEER